MWHFLSWTIWKGGIIDSNIGAERWSLSASDIQRFQGVAYTEATGLYQRIDRSVSPSDHRARVTPGRQGHGVGRELTISVPPLIFPSCVCFGNPLS